MVGIICNLSKVNTYVQCPTERSKDGLNEVQKIQKKISAFIRDELSKCLVERG